MSLTMHLLSSAFAIFVGYRIGRQNRWDKWHGPVAALIVMPVALLSGFDMTLSFTTPLCLAVGFLTSRV